VDRKLVNAKSKLEKLEKPRDRDRKWEEKGDQRALYRLN